jgi:ASC-1-like (ASCH) protein
MSEDIKNAISELGQTFAEFKKVNDERLKQIEKGESSSYNEEKLSKLEAKMDSYEEMNQKLTIAEQNANDIKEQVSKIETMVSRPDSGFESKQIDEYLNAFDVYCRKGLEGLM